MRKTGLVFPQFYISSAKKKLLKTACLSAAVVAQICGPEQREGSERSCGIIEQIRGPEQREGPESATRTADLGY